MPNQMQDALIDALSQIPEEPKTPAEEPAEAVAEPQGEAQPEAPVAEAPPAPAAPVEPQREPERVPLAVMLEERRRAREAEERLRQREQELEELRKAREEAAKPAEAAIPELSDDPVANLDARAKQLEAATKAAREEAQAAKQQLDAALASQQLQQRLQAVEQQFVSQHEDYYDALAHVRNVRQTQLKMLFPQAEEQQITAQIAQEEWQLGQALLAQGVNPAEYAYRMATTIGYKRPEPKVEEPKAEEPANVVPLKTPERPDPAAVRSLGAGTAAVTEPSEEGNPLDTLLSTVRRERGFRK